MHKGIEELIHDEMQYFLPINVRQRAATDCMRDKWACETIRERHERISLETYDACNGEVKYGIFEGLKLQRGNWWGKLDLGSQCLGLYEKEILDFLSNSTKGKYETFIDIGAGDGYYANGILKAGITKKVICFETSTLGQKTIAESWVQNGKVGDLRIFGHASANFLGKILKKKLRRALVLVDIEGNEFDLLTDTVLRKLRNCDMIIEVHNWVTDFDIKYPLLLRRLAMYFKIEIMPRVERSTTGIPELRSYTDDNRLLLTSERRPCLMRFLKLTPLVN